MNLTTATMEEALSDTAQEKECEDVYLLLKTPADLNMEKEFAWLQQLRCLDVFQRLLHSVKECAKRLHAHGKVDPRLGVPPTQPKCDQLHLMPKNGGDALKATIDLLGDNVIKCEIHLRHGKSPGGVYRGQAQPEVQWKLQQLQDLANYTARASFLLEEATARAKALKGEKTASSVLVKASREARNALCAARNAVVLPKKRTLLELCQFPPTKKFTPPLPMDQIVSVYVSGSRLICAVYQISPKSSGTGASKDVAVISAEALIPGLPQVLQILTSSLRLIQTLLNNMEALAPRC